MDHNKCLMQKSEALHPTPSNLIYLELVGVKVRHSSGGVDCWNLHNWQQLSGSNVQSAQIKQLNLISQWCECKVFVETLPCSEQLVMSNHYVILKSLFQKRLQLSRFISLHWFYLIFPCVSAQPDKSQKQNMSRTEARYQVRWHCVNSICSYGNDSLIVGEKVVFSAVYWKWHICHIVFPSRSISCLPGVTKTCLVTCLCQSPFSICKGLTCKLLCLKAVEAHGSEQSLKYCSSIKWTG